MDAATLAAEIREPVTWLGRAGRDLMAAIRGFVDGADGSVALLEKLTTHELLWIESIAARNAGKDWAAEMADALRALKARPLPSVNDRWGRFSRDKQLSAHHMARRAENQAKSDAAVRLGKKPLCLECGGTLPTIGAARANGRPHADWETRKLHKKCWKLLHGSVPDHSLWATEFL